MSVQPAPAVRAMICGNFSAGVRGINGQTIKTRILAQALVDLHGSDAVIELDTSSVFRHPAAFYWAAWKTFNWCTHVLLLPGPRAVHALVPLFARWQRRARRDVRYVVIGGFLPDYVVRYPWLRRSCARLDGIYTETAAMADRLRDTGFTNVQVLPNFRSFDRNMPRQYAPARPPLKLVFCSRIFQDKGIEQAMAAVECVNAEAERPVARLEVFGPIVDPYQARFAQLLASSPCTSYRGVLDADTIYATLQHYDLMLFPTYYYGEGFAGCIVDAFIAGVPVLASDWGDNAELVQEGRTGSIVKARSVEALAAALRRYVNAPELLVQMRQHCIERADQYHTERALEGLFRDIQVRAPALAG